jgi:hypothetical protein
MEAEYQTQLASYCAERHTVFTDEDAVLAYEATDPKHPGLSGSRRRLAPCSPSPSVR